MIPARWAVAAPPDPELTAALVSDLHIPEPLAAILVQRGLAAPDLAKAFLRPDLERLSDPFAWADMARAVELIVAAVRAGTPMSSTATTMRDRKSTRLNSSHPSTSYAVFCLKKKKKTFSLPDSLAVAGLVLELVVLTALFALLFY